MNRFAILLTATAAVALAVSPLAAQTDTTFTYQGTLAESGAPAEGSFDMEFSLFDALSGGGQVGSTIVMNGVQVADGLLTAELDFGADAFDNSARWLEIVVEGTTLSPRQPTTRAPYSIQTRGIFVDEDKNVGIGTTEPDHLLHVVGDTEADHAIYGHTTETFGGAAGVYGRSDSDTGFGLFGFASAFDAINQGVHGTSNGTHGTGVYGRGASNSGPNYGVYATSSSTEGIGLYASATQGSGFTTAIRAFCNSPNGFAGHFEGRAKFSGNVGFGDTQLPLYPVHASAGGTGGTIRADATGQFGVGVHGSASGGFGTTWGVFGRSNSPDGSGVFGLAEAPSGENYGVFGKTHSPDGYGGYFEGRLYADVYNGTAILGTSAAPDGNAIGVYGSTESDEGIAVYGLSLSTSGTTYGVIGQSDSPTGFDFWAGGVGTDFGSSSSIRWKSNIRKIDQPLEKIARLRGVYFDWDEEHGGQHGVGMIAEEVGEVLPEIVQYEENCIDAIGMDYSKMTPLLVEAVNAVRAEKDRDITTLREAHAAEINQLRQQLADLQQVVERLVWNQEKEIAR